MQLLLKMFRYQRKSIGIIKNQRNETPPKESKPLIIVPKEMEIEELPNKELKMIALKMIKIREQMNNTRKTI